MEQLPSVDIIAYAIPGFFALIFLEAWWARRERRKLYRLNDSIADLSCGVVNQLVSVFTAVALVFVYVWTYTHFAVLDLGFDWWVWLLCFAGVDLGYYWAHRSYHHHNLLWGAHVPHHSSEEFNYTVALRQGAFEPLVSWIFYQPLAVIGFPPVMFLVVSALNTLYQFLPHTQAVDRLPRWYEAVMNTPSHHRVHHGCDPKYLDRNYAGMFIVWDKLFGTFQPEEEAPTYGTVEPLNSWNPVWANFEFPVKVWRFARRYDTLGEKLRLWWLGPTALAVGKGGGGPIEVAGRARYDAGAGSGMGAYAIAQFVVALLVGVGLLFGAGDGFGQKLALALWSGATLVCVSAIFEDRPWVGQAETVRQLALPIFGAALGGVAGGIAGAAAALVFLRWYWGR